MDWVVKDKSTGEILSLMSITYGSGENEYVVSGGDGVYKRYKETAFRKKFEEVTADFSHVIPVIAELVKTNDSAKRIVYPLARRLHPGGYFKVGCLVYFQYDGYSERSLHEDIRQMIMYGCYGNDDSRTFIVLGIDEQNGWPNEDNPDEYGRIRIARYRGSKVPLEKYSVEYNLPICKTGFEIDAYYFLKRYDLPY